MLEEFGGKSGSDRIFRGCQHGRAATSGEEDPEDRWGVTRASGRRRQRYGKGGSVCLQVFGVRREAGARVKEGCSEGGI